MAVRMLESTTSLSLQIDRRISVGLKAVDFFCAGGGFSCGLQQAGIEMLAGIDIDASCKATYERNIRAPFIHADMSSLATEELCEQADIESSDDEMIFIACSPCQFWTGIRTDKTIAHEGRHLLLEFVRFVKELLPGYVLVENVPGILNRREESRLNIFLSELDKLGYIVHHDVFNMKNYNVPQSRKRFSLFATRLGEDKLRLPERHTATPTVHDAIGNKEEFPPIMAGYKDPTTFMHTTAGLSETNLKRLSFTPKNGGSRQAWANSDMQLKAYKGKSVGFSDTYGRMHWDKPSPTITTKFFSISNGRFAHPEQDRAISLREGATLQTFPLDYEFIGTSIQSIARMIGNALPPEYARRIGLAFIEAHNNE